MPAPEDDDEAAKYEIADEHLGAAGYGWYEVSNWALRDDARCRHNEGYWADGNWWGIGPGRTATSAGCAGGTSSTPTPTPPGSATGSARPTAARPSPTSSATTSGSCSRSGMVDGLPIGDLRDEGRVAVAGLIADGLVDATAALRRQRVVLTRQGRLLTDTVVRRLLGLR